MLAEIDRAERDANPVHRLEARREHLRNLATAATATERPAIEHSSPRSATSSERPAASARSSPPSTATPRPRGTSAARPGPPPSPTTYSPPSRLGSSRRSANSAKKASSTPRTYRPWRADSFSERSPRIAASESCPCPFHRSTSGSNSARERCRGPNVSAGVTFKTHARRPPAVDHAIPVRPTFVGGYHELPRDGQQTPPKDGHVLDDHLPRRLPHRRPIPVATNRLSRPISVVLRQPSDACHATAAATRRPTPSSCQQPTPSGDVQGLDGGLLPWCVRAKSSRSASRSRASRRTLAPTSNSTSTSWGPNLSRRSARLTRRATGSCAHRRRKARSSSPSRRVTASTRRTTSSSPTAAAKSPQLMHPFSTTS